MTVGPLARLEAALSPEVVSAIVELVDERVAAVAPTAESGPPWLSIEEAAEYLRVSSRTVERLIARGQLRATALGRRRLVRREDLDELAQAATGKETAPTAPTRRRRGVG